MNKLKREQMLLEIAQQLIVEQGMLSFKFTDIAKQAQIARATLYQHFHNKEDVLLGLYSKDAAICLQLLLQIQALSALTAHEKLLSALLLQLVISNQRYSKLSNDWVNASPLIYQFAQAERQQQFELLVHQVVLQHHEFWLQPILAGQLFSSRAEVETVRHKVMPYHRGLLGQTFMTKVTTSPSLRDSFEHLLHYTGLLKWRQIPHRVDYGLILQTIDGLLKAYKNTD